MPELPADSGVPVGSAQLPAVLEYRSGRDELRPPNFIEIITGVILLGAGIIFGIGVLVWGVAGFVSAFGSWHDFTALGGFVGFGPFFALMSWAGIHAGLALAGRITGRNVAMILRFRVNHFKSSILVLTGY